MLDIRFYLLTHEREIRRETSSSVPVRQALGESCATIIWKRREPNIEIECTLSPCDTVLVYPTDDQPLVEDIQPIGNFILLEGTWQEARKIYNRSPYLRRFPAMRIGTENGSAYRLRRNQKDGGLCTAETVIEILRLKGQFKLAESLFERFVSFQDVRGKGES
jgi:DTW domain-containing protein YfiP